MGGFLECRAESTYVFQMVTGGSLILPPPFFFRFPVFTETISKKPAYSGLFAYWF